MTTGAVSGSPFFWRSWSPFQKFKHYLGFRDPRLQAIFKSAQTLTLVTLNPNNKNSVLNTLRSSLAYLADYTQPLLEKSLKTTFEKASPEHARNVLTDLVQFCIENCNIQMLEACVKVVSSCPMKEIASVNADVQKRIQEINKRRHPYSASKEKQTHLTLSKRILLATGNLRFAPVYVVSTVLVAYKLNFAEIPTSIWAAQSQITFFRTAFTDFQSFSKSYLNLFSSRKKAFLVTSIPLLILLTSYHIYRYLREKFPEFFKTLVPEVFEKNLYKDVTELARKGAIEPSIGRTDIRCCIEANLSPPEGINPKAVILRGEPGVGKTQAMEDVAYRIAMRQTACLNERKLISVNAVDLKGKGTWTDSNRHKTPIDELLEVIQGKEKDYVLFIDEAHNLDEKAQEKLKTVLEKTDLCLVLATTSKEFQKTLAKNGPLLSRCDLPPELKPLEAEHRASILKRIIQKYNANPKHAIPINPDIVDTLISCIDKASLPGSEPRKSKNILEGIIRWFNAYTPEEPRLLTFLQQQHSNLKIKIDYQETNDEAFLFGDSIDTNLTHLTLLESKIEIIAKHYQRRVDLFNKRARLLEFKSKINIHLDQLKRKMESPRSPDEHCSLVNQIIFLNLFALKQLKVEMTSVENELKQGLPADQLDIKDLVAAGLITTKDSEEYAMPKEEKFLTTITPEFIEEYVKKLKEEEQITRHNIKKTSTSSSINLTGPLPGNATTQFVHSHSTHHPDSAFYSISRQNSSGVPPHEHDMQVINGLSEQSFLPPVLTILKTALDPNGASRQQLVQSLQSIQGLLQNLVKPTAISRSVSHEGEIPLDMPYTNTVTSALTAQGAQASHTTISRSSATSVLPPGNRGSSVTSLFTSGKTTDSKAEGTP